ncbi:MAG TPA: polyprenyl synthetase family protein [Pyrinomonadaceae bacterium]
MTTSSNAPDNGLYDRPTATGSAQFPAFIASNRQRLEGALKDHLPVSSAPGTERFNEALRYAVFPGGKRLRPHLTLIGSGLGGASHEQALSLACAVEFIHTSSLILDDLPGMDDAELRRNIPTLHVVYGEGLAVLVAVALLNQAYALFAGAARNGAQAERLPQLIREVADALGSAGMIAGQAAELALSGERAAASVSPSRDLKTTALMRLMMVAGGIICGAPDADIAALAAFGESLGKAYQIYDDLADKLGDHQTTGKSVGQDVRHLRPTLVQGLSSEEVRQLAAGVVGAGKDALARFDDRPEAQLLRSAADYIVAVLNPAGVSPKPSV